MIDGLHYLAGRQGPKCGCQICVSNLLSCVCFDMPRVPTIGMLVAKLKLLT